MRTNEFIVEYLDISQIDDIGDWQLAELSHKMAVRSPELYENIDSVRALRDFLDQYEIKPTIGQSYFPVSVAAIPLGKFMNLACAKQAGELLSVEQGKLYFDFGQGPKRFPFDQGDAYDHLMHTLLFHTLLEQNAFVTWVFLTFVSPWKIEVREI